MKATKYFMIPLLALLASGCQDEERATVQSANGEEVKFDATLGQNTTRTIYGPESDNAFPIYWVNGDEVIVSSPECAKSNGVGTANYKVTVKSATQNYATSLDKTGEIGVRWGENKTASFYSVYPASGAELGKNYSTVTLNMPDEQECDIVKEDGKDVVRPNMDACFMYAKTAGVKSGETVNLKYIPLSTAIRFKLQGPSEGNAVTVNSITLTAPEGVAISGKFEVDLVSADPDGNVMPTTTVIDGSNTIRIIATNPGTHAYLTLGIGESVEMNAFLLLDGETKTTISDDWSIQIATGDGHRYTKKLGGLSGGNMTLVPGKIHRLPDLPTLDGNAEWDPSDWMVNIPRNVYLSEISIPGSWNSLNSDSQGEKPSITAQYNAGIRAFHIDTRWRAEYVLDWLDWGYKVKDLGVADGGTNTNLSGGKVMTNSTTFEATLSEITKPFQDPNKEDDEFMVVICTFAQGSYDYNRENGGWEKQISEICAKNDYVIDAKKLNQNSVVKDVLGKVIVIVNTENSVSIPDSKCLFMNMGMTLEQAEFTNNPYYERSLTYGNKGLSGINVYGTHAQLTATGSQGEDGGDRGYAPTISQRRDKCENILAWSQTNYDDLNNYAHNAWLYLGLGGYQMRGSIIKDEDHETVAKTLNGWINGKITEMDTNGYYPVGIVLMNNATNPEYSSNVAKNILLLNTKYRQAYDPDRSPITGEYLDGGSTMQSVAPGYSSGMIDNQTDAIGWTRIR